MSTSSTSENSSRGKAWLVIGKLRLGTKQADEILKKQAEYILAHPEIYSIHASGKRHQWEYYEFKFAMHTSDVVTGLNVSTRHAQRLLKDAREYLRKSKRDYVSVAEFCKFYKLDEKQIRMRIVQRPAPGEKATTQNTERGSWRW